jgi:hypothetical protein
MGETGRFIVPALFSPLKRKIRIGSGRILAVAALMLASVALILELTDLAEKRSERLDAVELSVKSIEMRLSPLGIQVNDPHPTTLLVAIQFVTAAAERSTPFDTALAVAIRLIGEHPRIGPLLDQLLNEARSGVPSLDDLRSEFRAKLAEFEQDGLFTASDENKSFFRLSRLLDWTSADATAAHQATLQKLSADVANRDLAQAAQLIAKLDGKLREALEAWREKAQRRVAVDAVLTELRRASFTDLIGEAS